MPCVRAERGRENEERNGGDEREPRGDPAEQERERRDLRESARRGEDPSVEPLFELAHLVGERGERAGRRRNARRKTSLTVIRMSW